MWIWKTTNKVDPLTGEILDEDHLINEDVVQAILITAQKAIERKILREKNKKESAGAKWTPEEDAQLIEEYKNSLSIKEIAEIHKRSEGSIQSRIVKLWQNQQLENEKMQ
jgi:DNA-directed RNA polymerase specialized sigma24 family protein